MRESYDTQVLNMLRTSPFPVPCYKLVEITHRFGACIFNLRQKGHVIRTQRSMDTVTDKMHTTYMLIL